MDPADYTLNGKKCDADTVKTCMAICDSLSRWSVRLGEQFDGRYSNPARMLLHGLAQASSLEDEKDSTTKYNVGLRRRAAVLRMKHQRLHGR